MSERYYHKIYGDTRSKKIIINMDELKYIDKVLAPLLSDKLRASTSDTWSFKDQLELAKLLSISYYVLGGRLPVLKHRYNKPIKDNVAGIYSREDEEVYNAYFLEYYLKHLKRFNRDLGSWPSQVKWIRREALTSTFRNRGKILKQLRLLEELRYKDLKY